jgi:hypothetical protein
VAYAKRLSLEDGNIFLPYWNRQIEIRCLYIPRQAYGIDFYGYKKDEILVAIDLCTREVTLWFLVNTKMEGVARSLLFGLIFQKGVPLIFKCDEAKEFVEGVLHSMNQYLGIQQITTGKPIPGRRRQFELTFGDRTYKRDVAMIIPERTMNPIYQCNMLNLACMK